LDDGGYIMVVLLIGMAVSAVWMSAMLPSWRHQAMREKEADLIFRGEQYARAIALYWRKNNQTLPPSIDVLVSQRYLRKKYLDPITGKEFLAVGGAGTSPFSSIGQGGAQGRGAGPLPLSTQAQVGRLAGISGVRSTSTATSIVVYRGQTAHSQFPFDYTFALQRMGGGTPQPGPQGPFGPARGRGRIGAPVERGIEVPPEFPGRQGAPPMSGPRGGGRFGN
jgi:hypothetical protein